MYSITPLLNDYRLCFHELSEGEKRRPEIRPLFALKEYELTPKNACGGCLRTADVFPVVASLLGSFSIDDGNGSEDVSFKMNSRFFKVCRVYSILLKMASVGEFPWS